MEDFSRLLDEEGTDPLEADLLRLARSEGPTGEGRRRILAGLGVAAVVSTAATTSAATTKVASSSTAIKWLVTGAVAVGASVAGLLFAQHRNAAQAVPPAAPHSTAVGPALPAEPAANDVAAPKPDAQAITRLEDLPTLPGEAPRTAGTSAPSLAEEVLAIKTAKTALASGNPAQALHELDIYRARFPRGRLSQEAAVVRIEALVRAGNASAANAAADRFLSANGDSPYASRVRSLVGR